MNSTVKTEEMRESPRGRSMLSLANACPREWAWKYIRGFKQDDTPEHLTYGSIIHEAQAVFYTEGHTNALMKIAEMTGTNEELHAKCMRGFDEWFEVLGKDDLLYREVIAVEEEREITLYNGFKMTVRWDRVLRDRDSNEVFINDTKTTGWSLEGTLNNYMVHDQPKLYILAAQNEPWRDALAGWRTDGIYQKGNTCKVMRSALVMPTPEELEDIKISYTALTDDLRYRMEEANNGGDLRALFPKNPANCLRYYKICPHYEHCHRVADNTFHPEGFSIDPWLAQGIIADAFKEIHGGLPND
jgi:hypothetical protein